MGEKEKDAEARARDVIYQNSDTLKAIVQYVPGGVFVYSAEADGQFSFVSENMLTMLGYTREEFDRKFNRRFSHMIYEKDRERALGEILAQIAVAPFDTCIYRIEKKDGSLLWVHDEGHVVMDAAGKRWFYVVIVDITQSVKNRDALASQNDELRRLIDTIPASIVVYKQQGGQICVSATNGYMQKSFADLGNRLLSMGREELLSLIHPEDRGMTSAFFYSLFENPQVTGELTYRTIVSAAGDYQWCHCSAVSLPQADGGFLVYAVYTDATYQKVKEADFNRVIQELLTANPDSLCAFRLNLTQNLCGDCHGSSAFISQLLQAKTADELIARIAAVITDKQDAEEFRRRCSRASLLDYFRRGEDRFSIVYRRRTDNGEIHWVTTYFHILQNPYTKDTEAIAYSVDSDSVHTEKQIVSVLTNEEYDCIGLINSALETVTYYHISANCRAEMTEHPTVYGDFIKLLSQKLLNEREAVGFLEDLQLCTVRSKLADAPSLVYSFSCNTRTAGMRRKQITLRYLEEDHRKIMLTLADITATFEHEEAYAARLRAALRSAEKANAMKSDFLGNVSHDMRTPLNAILGYDRLAMQSDDPAVIRDYMQKIELAGNTLLSLINDTLDLQKIESGTIELHKEPVSCGEIIREVVTSVRPMLEKKNISFTLDNSRAVMATINVDAIRLREVFINLLSNAAKFTPEGGRVDLVVECLALERDCVHDRIIVRDTGVGMSREFQEKMFEPFSQERNKQTAAIGGSGLGLSIAKRLVDLMGGRIKVDSDSGKGTAISVWLDFERVDDRLAYADGEGVPASDIAGIRVLLCEDNAMNLEIARSVLGMKGALVTAASDGQQGCELFFSAAPDAFDIILMDIRMPVMNGYAAAAAIRASGHPRAKTIPILAMTADAYASDVEKALAAGMNAHISKPIDPLIMAREIVRLTRAEKGAAE
ncbi:MAG: ATP-binding protein [Oscillospiraceae bacterium]|nr:ATP-binding protein [Oscillospiraceae bacterium]